MPVPTDINSLSTTPSSNSPAGSEPALPQMDDHIRQGYSFIATLRDLVATKLSSSAVSAFIATLLDDADAATARTTLGAVGLTGAETVAGVKTFSSSPVAPTPTAGDNSTKVATTAYAETAASNAASSAAASAVADRERILVLPVVATTSGSTIDLTGIPSWAQRVTIVVNGLSTNGTSVAQFQLATAGGPQTSGYVGSSIGTTPPNSLFGGNFVASFAFGSFGSANDIRYGTAVLTKQPGNNLWILSGVFGLSNVGSTSVVAGAVTLTAALTSIRLLTNSADVFDAGNVHLVVEG